ncbi:MAG: hypothetical protein J5928_05660 [Firmicutes bacterium]|nr:hypothetical protein [Bacillota bacterium]
MGKIKVVISADNEEFENAMEYLLASSGYFDLIRDKSYKESDSFFGEAGDVLTIDIKAEDAIKKTFAAFLGELLEMAMVEDNGGHTVLAEGIPAIVSIASLAEDMDTGGFAVELGEKLFADGFRTLYISLKPLNQSVAICETNEKGFSRWLLDSKGDRLGPPEKYIFDGGEIFFLGSPIFNPNAGDAGVGDISKLAELCSKLNIGYLIIDIGCHIDIDRKKIFMLSDHPILFLEEYDESIMKKHFEKAIPLMIGVDEGKHIQSVLEAIEETTGEKNEKCPIWN